MYIRRSGSERILSCLSFSSDDNETSALHQDGGCRRHHSILSFHSLSLKMVKKKGKSKRTTLKDKYKIQRRVVETNRKRRKQAKRDAKGGIVRHDLKKKDPGIPNAWPFKQDLLKEIQRAREKQQQLQLEKKEKRKDDLQKLHQHQQEGGSARTVEQLMQQAQRDNLEFNQKEEQSNSSSSSTDYRDGTPQAGQQSRRAYLKELKKVVDTADVLLQVLDARDPQGTRIHPSVEDTILSRADKKLVLVLNKIDLVPRDVIAQWLSVLRRSHPCIAIKASANTNSAENKDVSMESTVPVGMEGLLQLLKNYARTSTGSKTTIVVGIIGYPNVGKSSIINALKRCRAVGVSSKPGFTTNMQEVVLDKNVRLLDSPGVVFDDSSALLGNCVHADSVEDPIPAVEALLERCNPASLMLQYNIPAFPRNNAMMFLAMVAKRHGRVLKGGVPDKVGAARAVLRDWNSGKIPYYTPPPRDTQKTTRANDAVVVSKFGKEFDVSQHDQQVLQSLQDQDEMDFVQLEDVKIRNDTNATEAVVEVLQGNDDDDDDEAMQEDDQDMEEDRPAAVSRRQLAEAEDFFEE